MCLLVHASVLVCEQGMHVSFMYVFMYVCIHACMHVYVYVCIYVCMCVVWMYTLYVELLLLYRILTNGHITYVWTTRLLE